MYLLAFVTLMIAFIGTYAQVLGMQTARFYSQQSSIAQSMRQWQTAGVSMAASIIRTNTGAGGYTAALAATGCSLHYTMPQNDGSGIGPCPQPFYKTGQSGVFGTGVNGVAGTGTITNGAALNLINYYDSTTTNYRTQCVHVPATCNTPVLTLPNTYDCTVGSCTALFDIADYQFYSVLYQNTGKNYVITFLQPACITAINPAPGFINFALTPANPVVAGTNPLGGLQSNITASDLMRQLKNSGLPNFTYGYITKPATGPQLKTGDGTVYPLPLTFGTIANPSCPNALTNAVAIIGSPDGY